MESLILMADMPQAGQVLRPIAEAYDDACALELYTSFLKDMAATAAVFRESLLPSDANRKVVLLTDSVSEDPLLGELEELSGGRRLVAEPANEWARVNDCLKAEFERGARAVAVLYGDVPTLPSHIIDQAFRALMFHDLVLGPTFAGDCYLIGARRPLAAGFDSVDDTTTDLVAEIFATYGRTISISLLPYWFRTRTPEDLDKLQTHVDFLQLREAGAGGETAKVLPDFFETKSDDDEDEDAS